MQYTETTYTRQGADYPAIQITWDDLKAAGFVGDGSDDKEIAQALCTTGAPAWVWVAEGWVDEIGYGLYTSRRGVVLTHGGEYVGLVTTNRSLTLDEALSLLDIDLSEEIQSQIPRWAYDKFEMHYV